MALKPVVSVVMGSQSDWETMRHTCHMLDQLAVPYEKRIVSAHRTPERLYAYAQAAAERGIRCVIAGAGGAAHLPGMIASLTTLPVLGVPVESKTLKGLDSLLSIVQMPAGVPVGTLAIGKAGATNAGLLAASIVAAYDARVARELKRFRDAQTKRVAMAPVDEKAVAREFAKEIANEVAKEAVVKA
jgi:5-(carboxyamino)imidazole ribonucleotide mutase